MKYLLDTNAWIHYLKKPASRIQAKLTTLQSSDNVTCFIVRSELLHGAEKYGNTARRIALIDASQAFLLFDRDDHAERWHVMNRVDAVLLAR